MATDLVTALLGTALAAEHQDADEAQDVVVKLGDAVASLPVPAVGESASSQGVAARAKTDSNNGGLKLSLKIRRDEGGGLVAVEHGVDAAHGAIETPAVVSTDSEEAAQLNALHDRMLLLSAEHGIPLVQPEAVSLMQRALTAHVRRLLIASTHFEGAGEAAFGPIRRKELNTSLAHPRVASWLPSCQRVAAITKNSSTGGRLL